MTNEMEFPGGYGRLLVSVGSIAAVMAVSGCVMFGTTRTNLSAIPTMPAAEGSARFSATKNDNTRIALKVKHLAHPERLTPPASHYVVWTRATKDAAAQNIGALVVDDDLTGTLDTETPLHSFELLVTAEGSGQVQTPSGEPLLWTSYSR